CGPHSSKRQACCGAGRRMRQAVTPSFLLQEVRMTKAQSVVDVILGEAGGRTPAERYADMVSIASVVANRASAGRVSPQDVVAVQREFNAYGKSLPGGVEAYRTLANLAWDQVEKSGPTHKG